ncbi:MAG: hypothetical protein AB7F88_10080 [Pyrinomonadaceae bacterium]
MSDMSAKYIIAVFAVAIAVSLAAACSGNEIATTANVDNSNTAQAAVPAVTPSNQITEADIAKLKWLEGSWRGMDGEKPFYERIRFEGTTMIVETMADESFSKANDTSRFELKDGEFGHTVGDQRSAAASISDDAVSFVPASASPGAPPKGSAFRFERQADGNWQAVLVAPETPARPASEKVYKMEPWKAAGK